MKPSILVGWGGALHFIASPNGQRSEGATLNNSKDTPNDIVNEWEATTGAGSFSDYYAGAFGGPLAGQPGGMSNHKPGAFYFGDFYYFQNNVVNQQSNVYLLRYDGSGIFANASNAGEFADKSHSGRGVKFLSPSGTPAIHTKSLCTIVHNDILFYVGAIPVHSENPDTGNWNVLEDWNYADFGLSTGGADAGTSLPRRRAYGSFVIHKKTRNGKDFRSAAGNLAIKYNRTTLEGLAPDYECLHGCDAISFDNDIIYANHCDIMRFPGGSGTATFIERNDIELSQKCFEVYPSGGFIDNSPVGDSQLMILTGSGVFKEN